EAGEGHARHFRTGTHAERLWADHGAVSLPHARPCEFAADLRLAGLRPGARVPWIVPVHPILGGEARGPLAFGALRAQAAHRAERMAQRGRRIPAAALIDPENWRPTLSQSIAELYIIIN